MRERQHWMDLFRGLAIILVITLHATTMTASRGVDPVPWLREFFLFMTPLRVPLLFGLSGMLLTRALQKPVVPYISGKIRHLVWPFLVWGIITVYLVGSRSQFADPWEWVDGFGHLWFLGSLIFCVTAGWFVKYIPAWVFLAVLPLLLFWLEPAEPTLQKYLFYGTYFFAGATLWQVRGAVRAFGAWLPVLCAVVGILGMFATGNSPMLQFDLIGILAPLPWFIAILWIGPRLPRMRLLESMGRNSVIWYCAHYPPLVLAIGWATGAGLEGVSVNLAALAGGLLGPLVLILGGRWTRWLFSLPPLKRTTGQPAGGSVGDGLPAEPGVEEPSLRHQPQGTSVHRQR